MPTTEEVLKALGACMDPELNRDIVSLDMVQDLRVEGDRVSFDLVLTTPACPMKAEMEENARKAALSVPGVSRVEIRVTANVRGDLRGQKAMPAGIRNVLAVASGKGGVGKSSVSVNIAVSLAADGARVGLMDSDIYGPNIPQMLGISGFTPKQDDNDAVHPAEAHGVKLMSMGFLLEPDAAAIWRGPMLHGAVRQFIQDIEWGELDYLIVDLPPGTGDVQLSLSQTVPVVGAVVVTTPQSIALSDVRKAVAMFKKVDVPILGIAENMSEFICPDCGKSCRVFGEGGAKELSEKYGVPLLGSIPLDPAICAAGENGTPIVIGSPDSPTARAFRDLARQAAAQVSLQNQRRRQAQNAINAAVRPKES